MNRVSQISQTISRAFDSDRYACRIVYQAKNGAVTERTISPIRFTNKQQSQVLALCCGREEPRQFNLEKIQSAKLVDAGQIFMPESIKEWNAMKILAIDPATNCGWAHSDGPSGTWDLSIRRDESAGMRLIRLSGKLREIQEASGIDVVVYEAARHSAPKMQGALVVQATLQGVIVHWCEQQAIEYRGYSPSEIKKHATGKGNANKQAMIKAAEAKFGSIADDNEADALWLLDLAQTQLMVAASPVQEEKPF